MSRRVRARASTSQAAPIEEETTIQPYLSVPPPIFVDSECQEWYDSRWILLSKFGEAILRQHRQGASWLFLHHQHNGQSKYIVVDEEYLCRLLGLNNEGSMFYFTYVNGEQRTATESTWKRDGALRRFDIPLGMDNQESREVRVKYMEPRDRLVCYLLHHNVIPRSSNKHKLRIEDFYVVDKLCHGLGHCNGIPMARLLLSRMWEVVHSSHEDKAFVFPLLISKILVNEGVEVDGEYCFNNEDNVIDVNCLSHLGLRRRVVANVVNWYNVQRRTYAQGLEQSQGTRQPSLEVDEENFQELPMREFQQLMVREMRQHRSEMRAYMERMEDTLRDSMGQRRPRRGC
ncbi:hypothetical protein CCACVL1_02837 [Corchorus capsularis]|uniref:Uncharacterized protein n=1 Tax=Corchorus capsularis TaxID=210143 RepID=A0A1R3K5E6_COCAP|nr:hypothetical protein CCACVL1_02837 [Corchorus capsularis]